MMGWGWLETLSEKRFYYLSKQKQHEIADRTVFSNAEEMLNITSDGTKSGPIPYHMIIPQPPSANYVI